MLENDKNKQPEKNEKCEFEPCIAKNTGKHFFEFIEEPLLCDSIIVGLHVQNNILTAILDNGSINQFYLHGNQRPIPIG